MAETKDEGQVVYYYDRARRLERAGPNAQFAASLHDRKKPGFFSAMVATRSLRFMFFTVLLGFVAVGVANLAMGERNSGQAAGVHLTASSLWFDGHVYLTLKRSKPMFSLSASGKERKAVVVRAGDGNQSSVGVMQLADDELRLRFPAEIKPDAVAVIADIMKADGSIEATMTLVSQVE